MAQDTQDVSNGDLTNAEAEEEQLPRLEEIQNASENEQSLQEESADKNMDLPVEANLSDKQGLDEQAVEVSADDNMDVGVNAQSKTDGDNMVPAIQLKAAESHKGSSKTITEVEDKNVEKLKNGVTGNHPVLHKENGFESAELKRELAEEDYPDNLEESNYSFLSVDGNESGTEEEQSAFMKELEKFFRERSLEFKPPKFYGERLNCLKLWRAVTKLGGYDQVTSNKLWRQVGESFKPPKTCTTVSWSFRCFYEKALFEYERHKMHRAELRIPLGSLTESMSVENQVGGNQASGSGRARRDAAARAMQGWHSQRLLGNGEIGDPIIKDKSSISMQKREKQLKSVGLLKRKKPSSLDHAVKVAHTKAAKPQVGTMVADVGPAADWVKINVRKTKDCFEVYALVPGLLREEVRVQSDPAGRVVISGEPEQPDNPWGVTPFKKVVTLPSRIDPHQTSAVVTLHGQLFVRVPFEQLDL